MFLNVYILYKRLNVYATRNETCFLVTSFLTLRHESVIFCQIKL